MKRISAATFLTTGPDPFANNLAERHWLFGFHPLFFLVALQGQKSFSIR
jgi:hypothetical protein